MHVLMHLYNITMVFCIYLVQVQTCNTSIPEGELGMYKLGYLKFQQISEIYYIDLYIV